MAIKRKRRRYLDAMASPTKNVSYGYVGHWRDGQLGWSLPTHASGSKDRTEPPDHMMAEYAMDDDFFTLCRITIEVVPGARRRRHPNRKRSA